MEWGMKSFNIFVVHGKIQVLGGGGVTWNQYTGEIGLKGGLGQFADLRFKGGAWQERGVVFKGEGVDTPMYTMVLPHGKMVHLCIGLVHSSNGDIRMKISSG